MLWLLYRRIKNRKWLCLDSGGSYPEPGSNGDNLFPHPLAESANGSKIGRHFPVVDIDRHLPEILRELKLYQSGFLRRLRQRRDQDRDEVRA